MIVTFHLSQCSHPQTACQYQSKHSSKSLYTSEISASKKQANSQVFLLHPFWIHLNRKASSLSFLPNEQGFTMPV
jgi:hypothetical protein